MNLSKIINNKEKYEKEFEVWKSVSSILNEETNFDKYEGLFFTMFTFLSFLLSFCLNYFLIEFNFETFFLLGIFGTVPITIFLCIFENFLRKIKYKKNIKYLKLFTVSKTTLMPSLEKKRIQYIKEKTDIVGFNNYLNFKNIIDNNNYQTNYDFIKFIISVIEKSENEEISKISEDELINFLKEFSLEEQELITNKIKEKISKKDLITDNIKNNLKEIKKISVNNNIIKEL